MAGTTRCADPECSLPVNPRTISGSRFGFAGPIHVTCYARRVSRAERRMLSGGPPGPRGKASHAARRRAETPDEATRWCPDPGQLDRMDPPAAARFILEAWGTEWGALVLTAEPRASDEMRLRGIEAEDA
jgi:hypothetical protein